MSKPLHELLDYQHLTGIVSDPRGGLPPAPLPESYLRVTRTVPGDSMKWFEVAGSRKTAIVAQRSSESQRREMKGVTEKTAKAIFAHEHMFHDVDILNMLRNMDNPQIQQLGEQELDRQSAESRVLLDNLRAAAIMSVVLTGYLRYKTGPSGGLYDPNGSTGTQIDFGIPAGNRNQLDILGDGATISATWATATNNIPAMIEAILKAAVRKSGYPITTAIYGANVLGYLTQNNYCKELINGSSFFSTEFGQNRVPQGFLGLNWRNGRDAFFAEPTGSLVDLVPADTIVFLPDASREQYELIEGTYEVPTNIGGISDNPMAAKGSLATVAGRFNYAKVTDDPVGIKHNYGDTFLPVLKVPNSIFIGDVTP